MADSYNNTKHRSLGRRPADVTKTNKNEVRYEQYMIRVKSGKLLKKKKKSQFKIGDVVRISHVRTAFDREYQQKWTGELFTIKQMYRREGIPVYKLKDWSGEDVQGTFYQEELQAATPNTTYKIESILKRRKRRGQAAEVLVRWLHWPDKYNSWIAASDMKRF